MGRQGRVWDADIEYVGLETLDCGGVVQLQVGGTLLKAKQKVMRIRTAKPTIIACELSSIGISSGRMPRIFADIEWQVGRGVQSARVEIGPGTTFTVAAAEVVDVTAFVEFPVPPSAQVEVRGTCGLASALQPMPAYLSEETDVPAGAIVAGPVAPRFAKSVRFFPTDPNNTALLVNFLTDPGGSTRYSQYVPFGVSVPVAAGSSALEFSSVLADSIQTVWEMYF